MKKLVALAQATLLSVCLSTAAYADESEKYGGNLVVPSPYANSFSTLDILHSADINTIMVAENIFEGLVEYDNTSAVPVPAIAKSWDIENDNTKYTFHLHEGAKFHHGREIEAKDFKYSMERLVDPDVAAFNAATLQNVKGYADVVSGKTKELAGVQVIDQYTLVIELVEPDAEFLYQLAVSGGADVVPQEEVERLGRDFAITPVSAGPFKVRSFSGSEIVLEGFKDYYAGRPYLDTLTFRPLGESVTRQAAFESEELDITNVSTAQYEMYKNRYRDNLIEVAEFYVRLVGFNMTNEKFADKRVRQAFSHAIDTELIVEKYYRTKAYPATGRIPASMPSFDPELKGFPYDPERAKQLLKEAGYENGIEFELIGSEAATYGIPAIEAALPYLRRAGFNITLTTFDEGTLWDRIVKGDYEAFISSLGGDASPTIHIQRNMSSVSRDGGNYTAYSNPAMDEVMNRAIMEADTEKRMALVREAEALFVEDSPYFFYNYNKAVLAFQPWVHGLEATPIDIMYQPFHKVWVDSNSPRK